MKLIACFLILVSGFGIKEPSLNSIRLKFHHATTSEKTCKELITLLAPYHEKNKPLLLGYKGGATMLMAKYAINPFMKYSYFKQGRSMVEKAILADDTNVELRFLRFTIQRNVPSILGYNNDLVQDRMFLTQAVSTVKDAELRKIITSYLNQDN